MKTCKVRGNRRVFTEEEGLNECLEKAEKGSDVKAWGVHY